jgi:CheY-like chemotaxis protein
MGEAASILLVDDEPAILESTRLLLEEMGYKVTCLSDATRIVETLRALRPRILLQDVRMPGLDLQALVKEIRADATIAATPVLLFSASMDLDELAERVGAPLSLEKPFRPRELQDAIQSVLK